MEALFLMAALNCSMPQIVNKTPEWTEIDRRSLKAAILRCGELYSKHPCVRVFTKKEFQTYTVICGRSKR